MTEAAHDLPLLPDSSADVATRGEDPIPPLFDIARGRRRRLGVGFSAPIKSRNFHTKFRQTDRHERLRMKEQETERSIPPRSTVDQCGAARHPLPAPIETGPAILYRHRLVFLLPRRFPLPLHLCPSRIQRRRTAGIAFRSRRASFLWRRSRARSRWAGVMDANFEVRRSSFSAAELS